MNLSAFALGNCAYNDTCLIFWSAEWAPPTAIAALKDAESSVCMPCLETIIQPHILHTGHIGMCGVPRKNGGVLYCKVVIQYNKAMFVPQVLKNSRINIESSNTVCCAQCGNRLSCG